MPFFKRKDSEDASTAAKTNGNGTGNGNGKEKINYKARLEHKMYLVRSHFFQSEESTRRDVIVLEKAVGGRPLAAGVGAAAMVALINLTFPLILHP